MNTFPPVQLIPTQSATGNLTGAWMAIDQMRTLGVQAIWTGTIAGAFSWEVTMGIDLTQSPPVLTGTATPLTVPGSFTSGNPAGSASSFFFDWTTCPTAKAIRIKYTAASGAGNLSVIGFARGGE